MTAAQVFASAVEVGEEELKRSSAALAFSGLAAGIGMGLSGIGSAALLAAVGAGKTGYLIASLLYPLGFIAVIVGRAQLFTENTLFPVILVLARRRHLRNTARLWAIVFASNVLGPFLVSKEALPHLRKRHGRIIHLGSLGGLRPWASHAHYCSSKAALHMLTRVMAKALAPEIAVNCVAPGMIDLGEKSAAQFMKRMATQTPMRRNGSAEDVAAAVLFFATAPHFITGQVLFVDGGLGL